MKPKDSIFCNQFDHLQNKAPKVCADFTAWLKKEHITMHFFKGSTERKLELLQRFFDTLSITFELKNEPRGTYFQINFGEFKPANWASAITNIFTTTPNFEAHLSMACAHTFEVLEDKVYW